MTDGCRAEFSRRTREITAQRAAYRCSFPNCDRITIGPAKKTGKASCIGIAAHIYSAAASGPRGSGGLSPDELKSTENAIWLCGNHASLIDKHRGEEYPPNKLHSYKALHEARIAYELSGIPTPFGWIDSIRIQSSPLFAGPAEIGLAKITLIIGLNASGKTALCEWIAASTDAHYLERWAKIPHRRDRVRVEVGYHFPDPHSADISFLSEDRPQYMLDNELTTVPVTPLKFIYPKEVIFPYGEEPNDLELVSKAMNLHPYEILALCEDMKSHGSEYVTQAWFEDSDEGCFMFAKVKSRRPNQPRLFRMLSGSERARVLMELGILAANRYALMNPTLLILDSGFWRLDAYWLNDYAELLGSPSWKFQTIATLGPRDINFDDVRWAGWKVVRLSGRPPHVIIDS